MTTRKQGRPPKPTPFDHLAPAARKRALKREANLKARKALSDAGFTLVQVTVPKARVEELRALVASWRN